MADKEETLSQGSVDDQLDGTVDSEAGEEDYDEPDNCEDGSCSGLSQDDQGEDEAGAEKEEVDEEGVDVEGEVSEVELEEDGEEIPDDGEEDEEDDEVFGEEQSEACTAVLHEEEEDVDVVAEPVQIKEEVMDEGEEKEEAVQVQKKSTRSSPEEKSKVPVRVIRPSKSAQPQWQPDDVTVSIRDVMENMMDEFAQDVMRINARYAEIRRFLITYFGTDETGAVFNDFDNHGRLMDNPHPSFFRKRPSICDDEMSVIETTLARIKTKRSSREEKSSSKSTPEPQKRDRKPAEPSDRERRNARRADAKENSLCASLPVTAMQYPFVSKADEERIFRTCGNIASTYAQRLSKVLFANSLHLYFKDQEPPKRDWLHEAVDFRFPTSDKNAQATKWKNCSNAINKNMRDFHKDKKEKVVKEIRFVYVTREQEQECYEKAVGDAIKYAEYLSLILFEGSWDKFFKEQDQKRKDWLRECVDKRFPINDKEKRDHRWKVCAAACNRNRTKVVGSDGKENPFPYFEREIEEKCFEESSGNPAVYAEMLAKHLFPDTQHLMFKDQPLGKRHWLHHHVDARFPTPNKLEQAAKWKTITQAINKNKTEGPVSASAPAAPVEKKESRSEMPKTRRSEMVSNEINQEEDDGEPENKRPRRAIKESMKMQEAQADSSPPNSKKPVKNGVKGAKAEPYSCYPYVSQTKEIEIFENCSNNPQVYAKRLGKLLFEATLQYYYKDQDPERRAWMREIVDFRFPSPNPAENKQKWKNVCASINKNMPNKE